MSRLVVVTFDLVGAKSPQYGVISEGLAKLRLRPYLPGRTRPRMPLPYNTVAGRFASGSSTTLRDHLAKRITNLFRQRHLRGRIFVAVGRNWAWAARRVK